MRLLTLVTVAFFALNANQAFAVLNNGGPSGTLNDCATGIAAGASCRATPTKFEVTINAIINYTKNTSGKFEISKKGEFIVTNQYSQTLINEKGLVKNLSEDLAEDIINELINRQDDL